MVSTGLTYCEPSRCRDNCLTNTSPTLFSPLDLGGITLRNRLIHAAIVTQYVSESRPTERLLNYYRARAAGGVAAIVTEPIAVTHTQREGSRLRAWDDKGFR